MSTIPPIEANRRKAQRSTGPRSLTDKSAAAMKALKTGIDAPALAIIGEDPEDLAALTVECYERHHPTDPVERCLVDTLVYNEWRLRRVEAQICDKPLAEAPKHHEALTHLQRWIHSTERSSQRTLRLLKQLQAPPRRLRRPAQPLTVEQFDPGIGFVPKTIVN